MLSTKILDDSVLQYGAQYNINIVCHAFTQIVPLSFFLSTQQLNIYDSIVFTSQNAVFQFFSQGYKISSSLSVFCISEQTQIALKNYGITTVQSALNAKALAEKIIQHQTKKILHVCSKQRLTILETKLSNHHIQYDCLEVYDTIAKDVVVDMTSFDAILFYSPSGVESFFASHQLEKRQIISCIGTSTATGVQNKNLGNTILISPIPTPQTMIHQLRLHRHQCNASNCE